jgi:hypothetical protein
MTYWDSEENEEDREIRFTNDGIYTHIDGPYDDDRPEYSYLLPAHDDNGIYQIVDCWIVDRTGHIHPGYNVSPVPIAVSSIGGMVRHIGNEESDL